MKNGSHIPDIIWWLFWLTSVAAAAINGGWPAAALMIVLAVLAGWVREEWKQRHRGGL